MYCDLPTFGRCCFCMPLRKGILTFGYVCQVINIMVLGVLSYSIHKGNVGLSSPYNNFDVPEELLLVDTCLDIIFGAALIYGAHMQALLYLKAYYYFTLSTITVTIVLHIVDFAMATYFYTIFFMLPIVICETVIQIYLLFLIRSLIQKLTVSKDHRYENPLEQIVYEGRVENVNGDVTVLPQEDV